MDAFDGVIVGERVGEDLVYRGVVEWGFRAPDVLALLRHARDFRQRMCPFTGAPSMRGAVWFEPLVKAEISYAEVMGGTLRAPSWRGLVG